MSVVNGEKARLTTLCSQTTIDFMASKKSEMVGLARETFDVIASRLEQKAQDIVLFTKAQYSFEEWINCEAFAACSAEQNWHVDPRPSYKKILRLDKCNDLGDLLVTNHETGQEVLVEIGLAHDTTTDKWLSKLDADAAKLLRGSVDIVVALHVIVLVSSTPIRSDEIWQKWLARLDCWNRPGYREPRTPMRLPPTGEMIIRGWATAYPVRPARRSTR